MCMNKLVRYRRRTHIQTKDVWIIETDFNGTGRVLAYVPVDDDVPVVAVVEDCDDGEIMILDLYRIRGIPTDVNGN